MDDAALVGMYRRWLDEVWGAGRLDASAELLAEDVIDHNPVAGQPPGRAGHDAMVRAIRTAFPDAGFTADVVFADGDYVTGRWTMTATNTGPFELFGLPPTGRPVRMTGQEIFRAEGGRFVEIWHCEDVPGMLTQLGLEPPRFAMRLAAHRSARRYRRGVRASGAGAR